MNVCQRGTCSWLEYARCGFEAARAEGVEFRAGEIGEMRLEDMEAFVAPRPRFTGMSTGRLETWSGASPVAWDSAVEQYVRSVWVPRWRARRERSFP